ncbi:unnamed protein product, partial [marine sediment metagenome]
FKSMVLKPSDFWIDKKENKRRVKKSGWLKYALACNLNLEKIDEREIDKEMPPDSGNWVTIYHFDYRAIAQTGRYAEGSGSASTDEREDSGKIIHDTRSLAQTRAMNRAISNLVGGGEVSAEEVIEPRRKRVESQQRNVKKRREEKNVPTKLSEETPQVDTDEEQVKTILTANATPVDILNIYKYGKKVFVVPRPEFPPELFEDYNETITSLLKAKWVAKKERWEISC